jgi:phosphatidate cytidylyltransferase
MLRLRILSALVLVPLVVWALFAWTQPAFALLLGAFILVGAWEWATLSGIKKAITRLLYVSVLGIAGAGLILAPSLTRPLLALALLFWLWVFVEHVACRELSAGFLATSPGKLLAGFLVLLPAWMVPLTLRQLPDGKWLTLYLMVVVWGADTGAYFAGHRWGRHKLAPLISPGKTWEGVGGGLVTVLLVGLIAGIYHWHFRGAELVVWMLLSFCTAFVSVLGDLFESRMKRIAGAKDSGTLIPGHGGVLDRIDAFTAAAPVFALAWLIWRQAPGSSL